MAHEAIGEIIVGVAELGLEAAGGSGNKMVIRTQKGEDVYTINPDLYLNKKEGDSIILK